MTMATIMILTRDLCSLNSTLQYYMICCFHVFVHVYVGRHLIMALPAAVRVDTLTVIAVWRLLS